QKLTPLSIAELQCTIYNVHKHLRNVNMKACEPEAISVGPYHLDKDNLKIIEDRKLCYSHLLLQHKNENIEKKYLSYRTIGTKHATVTQILFAFIFFNILFAVKVCRGSKDRSSEEIKHLLDLIHSNWRPSFDRLDYRKDENNGKKRWRFINNAIELRDANVKFKNIEGVSLFDLRFKDEIMFVALLTIEDMT
ncbi:hypothetical protein MIMGU_mgv1a022608mg, partial [Erythranthe guttata]